MVVMLPPFKVQKYNKIMKNQKKTKKSGLITTFSL